MTNSCFTVLLITRYLQLIPVFAAIGFSARMERDKSLTQNLGKRNKSENSSKWVGYTICSYAGGCCFFYLLLADWRLRNADGQNFKHFSDGFVIVCAAVLVMYAYRRRLFVKNVLRSDEWGAETVMMMVKERMLINDLRFWIDGGTGGTDGTVVPSVPSVPIWVVTIHELF